MRKFLLKLGLLLGGLASLALPSLAQQNYNFNIGGLGFSSGASVPGTCTTDGYWFWLNTGSKSWYVCSGGTYAAVGSAGSGTITPSAQYQIAFFPTAGTTNIIQGSSNITTDAGGDLTVVGNDTAASFVSSGTTGAAWTGKPGDGTCPAPTGLFFIICNNGGTGVAALSDNNGSFKPIVNAASDATITDAMFSAGANSWVTRQIGVSDWTIGSYVAGGGTAQAQTATLVPAASALTTGLLVAWKPSVANTSSGPTLAVNGLTATTITKCGTTGLVANDLVIGAIAYAQYDGTQFQLINPQQVSCSNGYNKSGASAANDAIYAVGVTNSLGATTKIVYDATQSFFLTYNNEATAGTGVAYERGQTLQRSESGADANLLTVTPAAVAGIYRACVDFDVSAATAATLGWTATWTDSNGTAQAPTNLALNQSGVAAPILTSVVSAGNDFNDCMELTVNAAGTAIVLKTTFTGTSITYKATATLERK